MFRRVLFFSVLIYVVCAAAGPLWAQNRNSRMRSSEHLAQSFQVLRDTIARLVQANAEWVEHNRLLEQNIQELKSRQQHMAKGAELFTKELADWEGKSKNKNALRGEAKAKEDEMKGQLASLNQEIALRKELLQTKQKQQERLWERLAVMDTEEGRLQNFKDLQTYTQEEQDLTVSLEQSRTQKKQFEQMLDYWTLLNADPAISVPKLMVKRDALIKERDLLSGQSSRNPRKPYAYQDIASQERIKKLDFEVKQLTKKRSESLKLLQTIEDHYNSDSPKSRSGDEKKIQASIVDLKKDNTILKGQLADLRFAMVSLDKKRAQLEQELRLPR